MAVNNSILAFYYIFNVLCLVQVGTKITFGLRCWMLTGGLIMLRCGLTVCDFSVCDLQHLFTSPSPSQGLSVMLVFTVFNSEVQEAWRVACLGKKSPGEDPPRPPQSTVSLTHRRISLSFIHIDPSKTGEKYLILKCNYFFWFQCVLTDPAHQQ